MSCPLHGDVWCTCRGWPSKKELEKFRAAGAQLAEDLDKLGKPCAVCGDEKGHTTFDEFALCRNRSKK